MASIRTARSQGWRCPSCTVLAQSRFASSASTGSRQVGPEHPRYIDIPEPPQQQKPPQKVIRGILPVPRDLFKPNRGGTERVTPESIAAVTKSAQRPLGSTTQSQAKYNEWRGRMTELRKQNLREGLMALKVRREKQNAYIAKRQARKVEERQRLVDLKEREDERLTNPSITVLMQDQKSGVLPDPNREERLAAMRGRVAAKEEEKVRARQDALHTLYLRARKFIVNEKQLLEHIEATFGTEENPKEFYGTRSRQGSGPNIWYTGQPPTLRDLLANASQVTARDNETDPVNRVWTSRLKRVTGELTGGKLK